MFYNFEIFVLLTDLSSNLNNLFTFRSSVDSRITKNLNTVWFNFNDTLC